MGVPLYYCCADVVKLADTPDLGSGASRREGSSPFIRTIQNPIKYDISRLKISKGNPMGNPNFYFCFSTLFFQLHFFKKGYIVLVLKMFTFLQKYEKDKNIFFPK